MAKANLNSLESRQFINRKVYDFKTRKRELENALSNSPELSDDMKEVKRRWLTKSIREETWTDEYQKHLSKVLEDSKIIMLFAKQKFWENPTKDQIDEVRTQFYWSEMDYKAINACEERNRAQFIVDNFGDSEKTLILLAQYGKWDYLRHTFFDQSSLVQQWKKFFNEPLWSEYDGLTTPESVRYHYWNTLQADIIILKKFGDRKASSRLNDEILIYFIEKAEWAFNRKMLESRGFDWAYSNIEKFDEDTQKYIYETKDKEKKAEKKEKIKENLISAWQIVTFPIWAPAIAWYQAVSWWYRKVSRKIKEKKREKQRKSR